MTRILAADIGGTSARFAIFTYEGSILDVRESKWLKSGSVDSAEALFQILKDSDFAAQLDSVDVVAIGLAGAIENGVYCNPPNLPWDIHLNTVRKSFAVEAAGLLNDFCAQAYACLSPIAEQADCVVEGEADSAASIAVVGAGTGLGKALLVRSGVQVVAAPSEGGHVNFSAETEREFAFQQFVCNRHSLPYARWDDVVSGRGLSAVHAFLTGEEREPHEVAATFSSCEETLEWFARFYGRVCRTFVLEGLALGGLYIAGGIAAKNPVIVQHPAFRASFCDSPPHGELLAKVPIYIVDEEESGLWGAAYYAAHQLLI